LLKIEIFWISSEQGFAMLLNWAIIMLGWAIADQGREKEGIIQMRRCASEDLTSLYRDILFCFSPEMKALSLLACP
jgi:hypothetical protein